MANIISKITPLGSTTEHSLRASALSIGTCSTAAGTAEKAVTCTGFTDLVDGATVLVKFNNTNTAAVSSLKLNVNTKGAKAIKYIHNGSAVVLPDVNYLQSGQTYMFYYDGTNWIVVFDFNSNTDNKVQNTLGTTSQFYVAGQTSSTTSTSTQVFDTGVYVTTTAGQLNATTYKVNEAVTLSYNSTTKSLDFIFA